MIEDQAGLPNGPNIQNDQAEQIDKRKVVMKYLILFFFLIIYGSIMVKVKQNYPQFLKFDVWPLAVHNYTYQQNGQQKDQQKIYPIQSNNSFTKPSLNFSYSNFIYPQPIKPIPQVIKSKVQNQTIKEQKVQTQTQTQTQTIKEQKVQTQTQTQTQTIKDNNASQTNVDTSQIEPSKYQPGHQIDSNGISIAYQSVQSYIVRTKSEMYRDIEKDKDESAKKKAQAKKLNQIKKQPIIRKQPSYYDFKTKLQQVVDKRCKLFPVSLYPYLREGATSPPKVSKFELIKYKISRMLFGNLFHSDTHFWDNLFKVCKNGWYWQSSGKKLTVGTHTQFTEHTKKGSHMLFRPTQLTLVFPYNIPSNERIAVWGVKTQYDPQSKRQKIKMRVFLGNFEIKPTQEERRMQRPIQRKCYCKHFQCDQLYPFLQIQSVHYDLVIQYIKIQSGFTVTVQH